MRAFASLSLAWLAVIGANGEARAQSVHVGDRLEPYLRLLQLTGDAPLGSFSIRPVLLPEGARIEGSEELPWTVNLEGESGTAGLRVVEVDAELRTFLNTRHPFLRNDGPVWQGKGLTTALDLGGAVRWKAVSLSIRPTLIYTQNSAFDLAPVTIAGMPEYAYPWRRIDMPQRFGSDPFWRLDPGQSELRLSSHGTTVGISTRNLWWGPGIENSITMSNNAGGFPHVFVGTRGPRSIGIGTVEANWIMGRLAQSDYFDPAVESPDRFLTGLVFAYSPSFLDGLSLGFARVFYGAVRDGGQPLSDFFLVLQGVRKRTLATPANPTGDDDTDQMLSFFARWVLSESGFEVYGEWARNDHSVDLTDFLQEPEHSQAYTLGLQKAVELDGRRMLALKGELTHLQREATFLLRASPVYYTHHIVTQGYTHRGQIIGAGIGPGGVQQHVGADLYAPWGKAGVMLQRRVHDNDAFYDWAEASGSSFDNHDVSLDVGVHAMFFRRGFEYGGGVIYTRELNRYFFGPKVNNFNASFSARWHPGS